MHYTNHTTPQLQLHYIATTAALHHTQSSSCGWGDHCNHRNHAKKHKSNHLSVNQWIHSAIRFWNFRHRLVRYYWYYKACTKEIPVLLCTTKPAQSISQNYFALQSLHKARPSTTLYYKACTKHVPALLCTTKPAQSTSQYYFVLQSLHKARPSTILCITKPAQSTSQYLLCTTKPAQSTSQYYFVLQSLHKARPSTTLYYKACTKHVPVLLETREAAATGNLNAAIPLQESAAKTPFATLMQPIRYDFRLRRKTQEYYACSCSSQEPWRSHSTAICRHWIAKHTRITRNGYTTCSYLQLQNRISTPKRKNDDFDALFRRKIGSTKMEKSAAKFQSTIRNFHAAITLRLKKPQLQRTKVWRMQLQQRGNLTQPFHCRSDCNTLLCNTSLGCTSSNEQSISTHAKHNSTASTKKKSPGTFSSTARGKRKGIDAKAATPENVARARAGKLFSATEAATRKNTMFRANPSIRIASMMQQFQCDLPRMTCKTQSESQDMQSSYLSNSVDATMSLRSADTELQRTIELQGTTV